MFYIFIIVITIVYAIILSAHYFLFHSLIIFLGITSPIYATILKIGLIILSLSFITASILINRFSNLPVKLFYIISSVWLGLLQYLLLACLLIYFILYLGGVFSVAVNAKILSLLLFLAATAIAYYGIVSAQNIRINKLTVTLPNLPGQWQNKRAIFISDLHLGITKNYQFADRLAGLIKALRPDLLFIGGDFYDGQKNLDLARLANSFSSLAVPSGKFFVTGNHEEFDDSGIFAKTLSDSGISFLNNKIVNLDGLQIIGVDYKTAYSRKDFALILNNLKIDKSQPSILLRHVPDKIDVAEANGISLMLSGHAHKGQLFPVEYFVAWLYHGFQYGLKSSGQTVVYTSSGAGTWGPPMRILANPEIVEITFTKK